MPVFTRQGEAAEVVARVQRVLRAIAAVAFDLRELDGKGASWRGLRWPACTLLA